MSRDEIRELIEKMQDRMTTTIRGLFEDHNAIAEAGLKALEAKMEVNGKKMDLVAERQTQVVQRIDNHIDGKGK